ncbi:MAG: alpha/beta hydrolase [Ornithinimicrobium sp.]
MAPELHTDAGPVRYAVTAPELAGDATVRPDLVLVHGWCCERSSMATLKEEFGAEHRIVEVDLRGHGESLEASDDGSMGVGNRRSETAGPVPHALHHVRIEDYGQDLWSICKAARLQRPILIGHSMGALAVLAALSADPHGPNAPSGGVLLDPAPVTNPQAKAFWASAHQDILRDLSGEWRRDFARSLFLPTDRAARIAVIEAMARARSEVAAGAAKAMAEFDGASALAGVGCPLLVIHANTAEHQIKVVAREHNVSLRTGQTVGAGHFHHLEVPEQVMPMIRKWMEVTLGIDPPGSASG